MRDLVAVPERCGRSIRPDVWTRVPGKHAALAAAPVGGLPAALSPGWGEASREKRRFNVPKPRSATGTVRSCRLDASPGSGLPLSQARRS